MTDTFKAPDASSIRCYYARSIVGVIVNLFASLFNLMWTIAAYEERRTRNTRHTEKVVINVVT